MRPRARLLFLTAVLAAVACQPTASPTTSTSPATTVPLREVRLLLSFRPDVQFAPFYLAQQEGYFADEGLDVSIEHADGGELIRLVAEGDADVGVADATDVMIAKTSGIPITYVSTLFQSFPVAVIGPAGSVPHEPADLAGMRIGTPGPFGSSWHALLALLDAGGLTAEEVSIREYPQFNQVEGLLAGDVDLITGFRNNEPLRLEAEGMATDLLTIDDVAPLPGPGVVVGDEALAADPSLAEAFARALARAQQAVIDDPEAGLEAAIAAVPTIREDVETARAVLLSTTELWASDDPELPLGAINEELWAIGYDTMERLGFIDGSVPLEVMIRPAIPID